ncbi:MAG: hypothetical protein HYZ90_05780, partial [Candidatus Omnitrophica bacterium]|nr:hypothetical protein [Candidatus Omnitrophota bacterium]
MNTKILFICGILLSALVGALWLVHLESSVTWQLLALGLLLLAPLAGSALRGAFDPIESIYFFLPLYGYLYLAKPLIRMTRGEEFIFGEQNFEWAMWVSILGLAAFYLGYYSKIGSAISRRLPLMEREVSGRRLRQCAWGFILTGAAGLWAYMQASGGWREFWSLPHGYGGKTEASTAYIYQLPELMVAGFFVIARDVIAGKRLGPASLLRLAVASIGGVLIYAVLWSRRTMIAWALITVTILVALRAGKKARLTVIALFWLILFACISLALAYRPYLHLGVEL